MGILKCLRGGHDVSEKNSFLYFDLFQMFGLGLEPKVLDLKLLLLKNKPSKAKTAFNTHRY